MAFSRAKFRQIYWEPLSDHRVSETQGFLLLYKPTVYVASTWAASHHPHGIWGTKGCTINMKLTWPAML